MSFDRFMAVLAVGASKSAVGAVFNLTLVFWLLSGPWFFWSDAYMLVGNTFMSAIAYVLLFAVLNTQARDGAAIQLKLDEIIRATADARNELIGIEQRTEQEIVELREET